MATLSAHERARLISSFDIDERATYRIADTQTATGVIDLGSAITMVPNLPPLQASDVLDSTLLAQKVADKKINREKQPVQWINEYLKVLRTVGWVTQDFHFKNVSMSSSYKCVADIAHGVLSKHLSPEDSQLCQKMVNTLRGGKHQNALTLFNDSTTEANAATFQMGICKLDPNSNPVLAMSTLAIQASEDIDNLLSWEWGSSAPKAQQGFDNMVLDENIYGGNGGVVRNAVIQKLGNSIVNDINSFDI